MSKTNLGWVYILTNPAFKEGMIKIGFTSRESPQQRADELSGATGVPSKFTVVWAARMPDAQSVERTVHRLLQNKRSNHNREFFECSVAEAMQNIQSVAGKNIVKTLDYRKKQPEKSSTPSSNSKKQPPKIAKKKRSFGLITGLVGLLILFLLTMLVIGWFTEKREGTKSPAAAQAMQSTQHNPTTHPVSVDIARQNMQLAWDKIPDDIQKDLKAEQNQWLNNLPKQCGQSQNCLINAYEQRAAYLKGFSIR